MDEDGLMGWILEDDGHTLRKTFFIPAGWQVMVDVSVRARFSGPIGLKVSPADESKVDSDGLTLDTLRNVPLGSIRRELAEILPRVRAVVKPPNKIPARIEGDHDYALLASEYVRLVNGGERRPIHVLADLSGISRNTVSARVRRARARGFLRQTSVGTGNLSAQLTEKAEKLRR